MSKRDRNKILIIVPVLTSRIPEQLRYIEGSGVYVHEVTSESGVLEMLENDFDYVAIHHDIYSIDRYQRYIHTVIQQLDLHTKVVEYVEQIIEQGIRFELSEIVRGVRVPQIYSLLDFVQKETGLPIVGAVAIAA